MLLYNRPTKPTDFDAKAQIQLARIETQIAASQQTLIFNESFWKKYKHIFAAAQYNKCAYCERKTTGHYGDVEHYRSKAAITTLSDDPKDWGIVIEPLNNVKGRKFEPYSNIGYWWLAYNWNNWLFACTICNSAYKLSLFPLQNRILPITKGVELQETPLLLNPFESINPVEHFTIDKQQILGFLKPYNNSVIGYETIKTCGLNRPSLIDARDEKIESMLYYLKQFNDKNDISYLYDIEKLGRKEREFAGIMRCIYEQETASLWSDLESWLARNPPQ